MPGVRTIAPEINIANNWHIIPTSGDLLANDTKDLTHFLFLHCFGSWPPKASSRSESEGSLKVAASAPPYSAYLLLNLSMNSKLNFPTLLLILHLVSNTMEQRKFGLLGYCT